ncbi:hypothetical protein F4810DRAFT_705828 [Camillea tinctor]|nr:hypothetical protein F4810DRAFT_705828 [Camillea tinctor]
MAKGHGAASSPLTAAHKEGPLTPDASTQTEVRRAEEETITKSSSSPPPPPSLSRFTRFTSLPPEIRYMIYDLALPPDVPELYILQADKIPPTNITTTTTTTTNNPGTPQDAPQRPTVYTAYPVLMHVSREARQFAQSRTCLRPHYYPSPSPSPTASSSSCPLLLVPYRLFRPDLDVLYVSWFSFGAFFRRPELFLGSATLLSRVQHVAVDMILTTNLHRLVEKFRQLRSLRSLRVVLGTAAGPFWVCAALRLPHPRLARRCALRPFESAQLEATVRGGPMTRPRSLEWYLRYVHGEARDETRAMLLMAAGDDGAEMEMEIGAWDREKRDLDLEIVAQVLVEYQRPAGKDGGPPRWVEKGRDRTTNLVSGIAWDLGIG